MKILVIGDSCTDVFIYGRCERLSPEAPIPVFEPSKTVTNDGMAGNVVANLRKLGVEKVELITNHEQITKTRYVEYKSNQMLLRVDSNDSVQNSFDIKKVDFDSYDAVIVADYDKGFLTNDDIQMIGSKSKLSFIDTKKVIDLNHFKGYTFVKMNEVEWERCQRYGAVYEDWKENLIVTMSERGCMYNEKSYSVDNSVEVRDLSGAGDTWMASFAHEYIRTTNIDSSIELANKNATLVVQKRGVTTI
jgi:bifunctional ADP-heptose synthase (sugar kinase/adenylyltransferase)